MSTGSQAARAAGQLSIRAVVQPGRFRLILPKVNGTQVESKINLFRVGFCYQEPTGGAGQTRSHVLPTDTD